ncbi:DUF3999 family protein [Cellvibrio mixtus]|uniref:DUF3999 family protein n=1 Tax=Cellvibrio mixtus TaxID=39650 RepID=UPI000586EA54|nr:DUF3999 family protein [Cellvibrio mixtus]
MMRIKNYLLGGFFFCASVVATAEVIPVYQIDQPAGTYLQTTLTHDIYRYAADSKLNDLVVTDQQGNKLPYRIGSAHPVKEQVQHSPLHFFPVAVGAPPETLLALSSASIKLDANEISVSVEKTVNEQLLDKSAPIDFFVVDLSDTRARADKLIVDWQVNETNQYLEVQVSGTNDLTNWSNITQATLAQLQKDGQKLVRNKINLNLTEMQYAYVRLKFLRGGEKLQLTGITLENTEKVAATPVVDSWKVTGELADEQESVLLTGDRAPGVSVAAWEFTRDDIAPVSRLGIELGSIMYGDVVRIFSRSSDKQPWQLVHQGIWFNAQVGNEWQQSDAITVNNNSDTQWRVELNEFIRTKAAPVIVFHHQPETLQFIANNSAPFNIAIETDPAQYKQNTSAQVFSQLISGKKIQWVQANFTELKPAMSSFARHGLQVSWKTILFWAILMLAVGVLVLVALRLVKQMSVEKTL